jgi:hypothetical protein
LATIFDRWYTLAVGHAPAMVLLLAACAASPDRPPVARIAATPAAVAEGDDFQTAVTLDGTRSQALDDPAAPLTFAWQLLDDEVHADGALDQPMVVVHCLGARPPRIVLTVTDEHGLSADVTRPIALTVP